MTTPLVASHLHGPLTHAGLIPSRTLDAASREAFIASL